MLTLTSFIGTLLGDNAYWPRPEMREKLLAKGITVIAAAKTTAVEAVNTPDEKALLKAWRGQVERRIGLFDQQFSAQRTLNRSELHYRARRKFKMLTHNASRWVNAVHNRPIESLSLIRAAA